MNVIVCIKRVPDTETRVRIGAGGTEIDPAGVKYIVSPYDEFAIEAGLRLVEKAGSGEVTVVTVGDAASAETLRSALAMGAHRAILLKGTVGQDGMATAQALAAEFRGADAPLILLGVKAADDDQQQVAPMLATLLGRPCATAVSDFELSGDRVTAHREVEGGSEVMDLPLPAVLSITKGAFEPRYASLKGIMAAKKKPLDEKEAQLPPARLRVQALELPPTRSAGRFIGEGADAVPELVRRLREEAGVL